MALEAVVFPQDHTFTYGNNYYKDNYLCSYGLQQEEEDEKLLLGIINNNIEQNIDAKNWDSCNSNSLLQPANVKRDIQWEYSSPEEEASCTVEDTKVISTTTGRRKRRRTKNTKNKEEIENQRMTHITVERNRRKQMNEYLAALRSLMPSSYVQRGDQASIIGGAINFVKELEQLLQSMGGKKERKEQKNENNGIMGLNNGSPFAEFFTFPQYTTTRATDHQSNVNAAAIMEQNQWAVADIEVTMVDSHANLKILSKKHSGQLMKMVVGLQSLRLSILHLNVTTLDHMVLYSVSVKVEEGSQLNTVDEIAAAVNQLLRTLQA